VYIGLWEGGVSVLLTDETVVEAVECLEGNCCEC
jgi:hypothetical protein